MDLSKIFDLMGDENINKTDIFKLVDDVRRMDLNDENSLRSIIKKASNIANKDISKEKEDDLVNRIKQDGLPSNIMDLF